jgi:hypothetical protein
VDLTAYVEKHEFVFDAVLDQYVSNDEVYRTTVEPIVPTIFQRTKATCFAYGQTGKHDRTYLLHLIVPCWLCYFTKLLLVSMGSSYCLHTAQQAGGTGLRLVHV